MAVPFDLARLEVTGGPIGILDDVMQAVNTRGGGVDSGAAQFSVSQTGTLVYLPGGVFPDADVSMLWVDRNGAAMPLPVAPRNLVGLRLSPDGERVAFWTSGTNRNVWVYEISRGALSRLTPEGQNGRSVWSADGERVTFDFTTAGRQNVYWKAADGSSAAERLTTDERSQLPSSWSPDGKTLAFIQMSTGTNADIWTLSLADGVAKSRPFLETPYSERYPEFSPDGRWIAYVSNESGRDQVYVQPYPGPGARHQVSTDLGSAPLWARSGRELFYIARPAATGFNRMMAVDVTLGATFTAGKPRMLFEGQYPLTGTVRGYDVSPDGRRFLLFQFKEEAPAPAITEVVMVQNWFEELQRKVPAGGRK